MFIVKNTGTPEPSGFKGIICPRCIYTVIDEDTGESQQISGRTLAMRIRKDTKAGKKNYKNAWFDNDGYSYHVNYRYPLPKPAPSLDIEVMGAGVNINKTGLNIQVQMFGEAVMCIYLNDLVLECINRPVYTDWVLGRDARHKPYDFNINDVIEARVSEDDYMTPLQFYNVQFSGSCMKCLLHFEVLGYVLGETNVDTEITIDFAKKTLTGNGKTAKLRTKAELLTGGFNGDWGFKKAGTFHFRMESCYSNYFPCRVEYDGRVYGSSEAAYQSMKTMDISLRNQFVNLSPDDAKHLGRQIESSGACRKDWDRVKFDIMHDIVLCKFSQNPGLKKFLFTTNGFNLIEDTTGWHDKVWGKCYCDRCQGKGQNHLGKILTQVRKELGGY